MPYEDQTLDSDPFINDGEEETPETEDEELKGDDDDVEEFVNKNIFSVFVLIEVDRYGSIVPKILRAGVLARAERSILGVGVAAV